MAGESTIRKVIHVDMDAFFASVEQRDDPSLRGRPVAVGHGAARGVVAAASYEARKFGVRSALPSVTAIRRCPDLVFVPPRFEIYRAVSAQIHAIFSEFTDLIQPLSLDEAYLDVTANKLALPTAWLTAKAIRARILEETGLTASAGISYNKFLAKLASDHRKPNGQFAVTPEMGAAWVETLPVSRFHGVGPVTADKMKRLGIETGADLRSKSLAFLQQHFGSSAEWYHAIARGEDHRPVPRQPGRCREAWDGTGSPRSRRAPSRQGSARHLYPGPAVGIGHRPGRARRGDQGKAARLSLTAAASRICWGCWCHSTRVRASAETAPRY